MFIMNFIYFTLLKLFLKNLNSLNYVVKHFFFKFKYYNFNDYFIILKWFELYFINFNCVKNYCKF